jgi:hypothetical protein
MEANVSGRQWWKARPEEWALLCGGGDAGLARKWGVMLGIAAGAAWAGIAVLPTPPGFMWAYNPSLTLAVAGMFVTLSGLAWKGKPWAFLGLMGMITACLGVPNLAACLMPDIDFAEHPAYWMCRAALCLASWVLCMRVLYLAYGLQRRAATVTAGQ